MANRYDLTGDLLKFIESTPELKLFIGFVLSIIQLFGHTDAEGRPATSARVMIPDPKPGEDMSAYLRMAWDARSHGWMAFETAMNYALSMMMISRVLHLDLRRPHRVLSIGQGSGLYEIYLAWYAKQAAIPVKLACVDFSLEMSRVAQQVRCVTGAGSNEHPVELNNIQFVCGDMNYLPIRSQTIDHVICNNALQWSTNWQTAIKEMAKVLNPYGDGMVYITFPIVAGGLWGDDKKFIFRCTQCVVSEILDEMEAQSLSIETFALYMGESGSGQLGTIASRYLVAGQLRTKRRFLAWRENKVIAPVVRQVIELQKMAIKFK